MQTGGSRRDKKLDAEVGVDSEKYMLRITSLESLGSTTPSNGPSRRPSGLL